MKRERPCCTVCGDPLPGSKFGGGKRFGCSAECRKAIKRLAKRARQKYGRIDGCCEMPVVMMAW